MMYPVPRICTTCQCYLYLMSCVHCILWFFQPSLGWGSETLTVPSAPRERTSPGGNVGPDGHEPPIVAPLSVLLDVSASIPNPKLQKDLPPTLISRPPVQGYNLKSQVSNCTSNTTNCTVALRTYNCENFTLTENQSMPMRFHLNKSHVVILISQKLFLQEKNPVTLQGNYNTIQFIDQFSHRGFSESIYI